jgi:glucose/arabinose dehydrogenase
MRRSLLVFLALATACNGEPDLAPTTTAAEVSTTTTVEDTTSTTEAVTTTEAPTTTTLQPLQSLAYEEIARIDFPIQMVPFMGDLEMVATKAGRIYLLEEQQRLRENPILDISDQVRNQGEQGLLSIAVFEDPSRVFVHYSASDGDTVVSEFTWDGSALVDEHVWLRLDQPARNHNGGMLQFGPDGDLYLGLGDGGGSGDRFGNGQNQDTLLGGLVRIDVHDETAEPQLFQYGLRNPWRFWIDQVGDPMIYIADVGQNSFEEVSVAPFQADINYGWPITEGLHCFRPSSGCDTAGLTLPVIEVAHGDAGTCSITGGMVYRGLEIPEINGHFFYSDYCGGYLRSFRYEDGEVVDGTDWTEQVGVPGQVASFGVDTWGEMYLLTTDRILRVVPVRG